MVEARHLFLLVLVLLLALSFSLSAHQSEDSLDSPQLRLSKRQTVPADVICPKLVNDLFQDVTISPHTKANIIKSLPYSSKEERCGEFMFNLTALNATTEYIFTADLYLWLHIPSPLQHPAYYVHIKPLSADHRNAKPIKRELKLGSSESDHYVKFDVSRLLREFVSDGESSILLQVSISSSIEDFDHSILSCNQESEVRFAYRGFTSTTIPVLMVYSYANMLNHINYTMIAREIRRNSTSNNNAPTDNNAQKKRSAGFQNCDVQTLHVDPSHGFFTDIIKPVVGKKRYVFVTQSFDAGTCQGDCDFGIPKKSPSNHAKVLDFLIKDKTLRRDDYTQCCVPVTFRSKSIRLNLIDSNSDVLVLFKDVAVEDCECLSFLKTSAL